MTTKSKNDKLNIIEPKEKAKTIGQVLCNPLIILAALGYFVDIYDLLLFSIVRVPSLSSLGLSGESLLQSGIFVINMQMAGLIIGGVIWGILGDKKGRLSVLLGSILIYSLANIANGFATTLNQYALCRIVAGIGLAGELGAGITLVSEVLPKKIRGYGTTLVASIGLLGAVFAYYISTVFEWRTAYFIGGGLGLSLLLLRVSVSESAIFTKIKSAEAVSRGNFLALLSRRTLLIKYMRCVLIGLPIWFVIGILITFSPEFYSVSGGIGLLDAGKAVMFCYIGLSLGDLSSGLLSQAFSSRKKVVFIFLMLTIISVALFLFPISLKATSFYLICLFMGFSIGYWALFVTISAEQFGTNIRSTVATTVPNFVRGSVIPMSFLFEWIRQSTGNMILSASLVGVISVLIALFALFGMEETFNKDMDYVENL